MSHVLAFSQGEAGFPGFASPGALMTSTLHDRTVLPPAETESLNKLLAAMQHELSERAVLVGPDDTRWELPNEAYWVLKEVLEAMSQGLAITVVPQHTHADHPGGR